MRVLILRLSALGDVLTATPVAGLLRRRMPEAHIAWLVERHVADVLRGNPAIDELIVVPTSRDWKRLVARPAELCRQAGPVHAALSERFDVVLDLQGLLKSAVYARAARAPRKIRPHDAYERIPGVFTESYRRRIDPGRVSSMYVGMLPALGIEAETPADYRMTMPLDEPARAGAASWLAAHGLPAGGYAALVPGTTRPQKHWDEAHWAPLARLLHERLGLPALVIGGPAERGLAARIAAAATTPLHSAAGETDLRTTGALLEAARAAIAVDTGPMHMAVAVGCPTVAIFGSTAPRWFGDGSVYAALWRGFPCSPCGRHPTCRRFECLTAIRPEDVARRVAGLLEEGGG